MASKNKFTFQRREDSSSSAHCSVPRCTASARCNSVLSFYSFPKDEELQGKWLENIKRGREEITDNKKVCGRHFLPEDVEEPLGPLGRRMLKKGAVPLLFDWNNYSVASAQREGTDTGSGRAQAMDIAALDHNYYSLEAIPAEGRPHAQTQTPVSSVAEAQREKARLMAQKAELLRQIEEQTLKNRFGLQRFAGSDQDIKFYTGFQSYAHLVSFWSQIEPATQEVVRLTRVLPTVQEEHIDDVAAILCPQPIDEFFLFLSCLTVGLDPEYLAHRCNLPHSTMIRIVITWANFLYMMLGSVDIWLDEETVRRNMPEVFSDYADTQVVLESIELRCQTLDSVLLETEAFRGYKHYTTVKGLAAIAPHGPVTFVSPMYDGNLSDRDLLKRSGLLSLLRPSMAVMVDKRFDIEDLVPGKVHLPLQKKEHDAVVKMEVDDMTFRVYLFHIVGRLGKYELFKSVIPFSLNSCLSQLFAVACLLPNYQDGHLMTPSESDE